MLRSRKNVLTPHFALFRIALVENGAIWKTMPTFNLLHGDFAGVDQEAPKLRQIGKESTVQLNYQLISRNTNLPPDCCRRLVREMLLRVASWIRTRHPLQVEFPTVGNLVLNRCGQVAFRFYRHLLDFFQSEGDLRQLRGGSAASPPQPLGWLLGGEAAAAAAAAGAQRPRHTPSVQRTASPEPMWQQARSEAAAASVPADGLRHWGAAQEEMDGAAALAHGALRDLWDRCQRADRICNGCVSRLQMETWLQSECRSVLAGVDAATIIELLRIHTSGKAGQDILYPTFISALERQLQRGPAHGSAGGPAASPPPPAAAARAGADPQADSDARAMSATLGSWGGLRPSTAPADSQLPEAAAEAAAGEAGGHVPYYMQSVSPPSSRQECDSWNKFHFDRLYAARAGGRGLTPKPGEEPLTLEEAGHMRTSSRSPPPGRWAPGALSPPPPPSPPSPPSPPHRVASRPVEEPAWHLRDCIREERPSRRCYDLRAKSPSRESVHQLLRRSWDQQIEERKAMEALHRQAEERWPYTPQHRPEWRFPLFTAAHYEPDRAIRAASGARA